MTYNLGITLTAATFSRITIQAATTLPPPKLKANQDCARHFWRMLVFCCYTRIMRHKPMGIDCTLSASSCFSFFFWCTIWNGAHKVLFLFTFLSMLTTWAEHFGGFIVSDLSPQASLVGIDASRRIAHTNGGMKGKMNKHFRCTCVIERVESHGMH